MFPLLVTFLYNVKQIEVVYGPASALYGADAFTGVINLITLSDEKSVAAMGTERTMISFQT